MSVVRFATVLLLASAAPAAAQSILPALACYEGAHSGEGARAAINECVAALHDGALARGDRARVHLNRGVLYVQSRAYERALGDFQDAARIAPDLAGDADANRAAALIHLGRHREALAAAERALAGPSSNPAFAHFNRAVALEHLRDFGGARQAYQDAALADPNWPAPAQELRRFRNPDAN
ncbi:MAG: tetratricopeptide repeat protein [Maricaulaceae bacterium]|nr:tetratricopeptide repeat protein [Maricaulaceae bacterium]